MARLRLFASIREAAGTRVESFDGATVGDVVDAASAHFGDGFTIVLPTCRIWLNGQPAALTDAVTATDEIALLPPVSGG